jgi:hypothetical protein
MAIKIVREINIINREWEETVNAYSNIILEGEIIEYDYSDYPDYDQYFEVVTSTNCDSFTVGQGSIRLYELPAVGDVGGVTPTGALVRKTNNIGGGIGGEFTLRLVNNTDSPKTMGVRAARLRVVSSSPGCPSQIEIGAYEADLYGTTWKECTYPKRWYYNSSNWDGTVNAYGEVVWVEADNKYAFSAKLQKSADQSTWYDVTGGLIVDAAASETITRTRQSSAFTLDASYPYYRLVHMNTGDKASRGYTIYCAKIVIVQTGTITKTESTFLLVNKYISTTAGLLDFDQYYDPDNWSDTTVSWYHEIVSYDTGGGTTDYELQSDPNGTPATITNSAIDATSANQLIRAGSAMTMPGTAKEIDLYTYGLDPILSRMVAIVVVVTDVPLENEVVMVISNF